MGFEVIVNSVHVVILHHGPSLNFFNGLDPGDSYVLTQTF